MNLLDNQNRKQDYLFNKTTLIYTGFSAGVLYSSLYS